MSGAAWYSACVPSSFELDTSARRTPALRRISIAVAAGNASRVSWL